MNTLPSLGIGIGWRPELALAIDRIPDLGFIELTVENTPVGQLPPAVQLLKDRGVQIIPHGVTLSLGGAEPVDPSRVRRMDRLAKAGESPLVSEHIAFVRAGGVEIGHLTPLPRTRDAVEVIIENVRAAKQHLSVPLALENIAALFDWPDAEMTEIEFVSEILRQTACPLLLDLANLYANSRNVGVDPAQYLDAICNWPIAYVHMGGGVEQQGVYHDTHAHPVHPGCLQLLEELCARTEPAGVMLERDDDFPAESELHEEMDRIRAAVRAGRARRKGSLVG